MTEIRRLHFLDDQQIRELCDLLIDCVENGASVSFMHPLTRERAEAFWRKVAAGVVAGSRALLVAEDDEGRIVGTVQAIYDLPENQPHRGDVAKMLVHSRARRQGLGASLLAAAEEAARGAGRTLLVLDTVTGGDAERLYAKRGWQECGKIPDYALSPHGESSSTTVFYKRLT